MLFSKCVQEPNFIDLYMELADQLFNKFKTEKTKDLDFKGMFLVHCQMKLQGQDNDILLMAASGEDEDVIMKKKERIRGSVRLIAELFIRGAIPDDYVKICLDKLMNKSIEDNIESAIYLLNGIGKKLYEYFAFEAKLTTLPKKPKLKVKKMTKELLDDYIDKLIAMKQSDKISSRVKFAVQDLVDSRDKVWSNAFNQFPVAKQVGKIKEEIVAYRKKTKSIEKSESPDKVKPASEPAVLPATKAEEEKKPAEQNILGRNLDKYHKSKLEEKNRVLNIFLSFDSSSNYITLLMSSYCQNKCPMSRTQ